MLMFILYRFASLVPTCTLPIPFLGEVLVLDHMHDFQHLELECHGGGDVSAFLGKRELQFSPRATLVSCGCWEAGRMAEVGLLCSLAGAVVGYLAGA